MTPPPPTADDAEPLLRDAAAGDAVALQELQTRHRDRLRRMVSLRLSSRLAARVDPSDVVREVFAEVGARLADYVRERPMPFYPWLHRLAAERLETIRRRLMPTEAGAGPPDPSSTFAPIAVETLQGDGLRSEAETTSGPAPLLQESRRRTRAALESLAPPDREVLVLHYLEELDFPDIAAILDVDARTVKKRHLRALRRMNEIIVKLDRPSGGGP